MKNSIFWEIKKAGISSYLLGTVHVHDPSLDDLTNKVLPFLLKSSIFATELDFDDVEARGSDLQNIHMSPEQSIVDFLGRNDQKRLDFWLKKKTGMPGEMVHQMNPITIIGLLSGKSFSAGPSLDQQLFSKAKEAGLPCVGLETLEEQMAVLSDIPYKVQAQYLSKVLRSFTEGLKSEKRMLEHYLAGDARQLYQSVRKQSGGMRKILIYQRNEIMAKRFAEIAETQSLFAGVGAAHLMGSKGMLRHLKLAGFTVKGLISTSD